MEIAVSKTLSRKELSLIGREGERIKSGLSNLVDDFPNHAKTITGMSKWLTANKSTCQRMVETINKATDGIQVIQTLPGPAGLKGFIDLAEEKNIKPKLVEEARAVVQRFENLIYEYSRSHSALKKLIQDSSSAKESSGSKRDNRKAVYDSVKAVSGESMEHSFLACILKESDQDSKYLQQYTLNYFEGCHSTETSRPVMVPVLPSEKGVDLDKPEVLSNLEERGNNLASASVIKELTSPSILDHVDEFTSSDNWMVVPSTVGTSSSLNIGVIKHYPKEQLGPFHGGKKTSCVGAHIRYPTENLYIACFLEKKYAMRSVANVGIYSSGSHIDSIIADPDAVWYERFSDEADLGLSSSEADFNEKFGYTMANDLIDQLFSMSQCNREDYTCFLMRVEYPIWSTAYRIYFQYAVD